jgi:hypothetical protein
VQFFQRDEVLSEYIFVLFNPLQDPEQGRKGQALMRALLRRFLLRGSLCNALDAQKASAQDVI